MRILKLIEELKNPSSRYRPIPFWSWNDKLNLEEIQRQIKLMHKAGFGGFFMHARGGLKTEYMSGDWISAIETGINQGKKLGMLPWLYDENGWPSGFANGKVNGLGPDYEQKFLRIEKKKYDPIDIKDNLICIVSDELKLIEHDTIIDSDFFHMYYETNPYYVDTLNEKVSKEFLKACHNEYKKELKPDFWNSIEGFFIDEPTISRNGIPWSFQLESYYWKLYKEELFPRLPSLFFNIGDYNSTRYRFWSMVSNLFRQNFLKEIYDWCNQENIKLTGHLVEEETFAIQHTSNGAVMPLYEYFHIPGMDWLGRSIDPDTTPLQVCSASAQLGKKQILSETFALTGWNITFEEMRWIAGWQMVFGVNLICQHLSAYSLKGIRKRDYPPSLFYQQPWWNKYNNFNDTISRIGVLLSEGSIHYNVLLLHTISSVWMDETLSDKNGYYLKSRSISDFLNGAHINYHYGDPEILKKYGSAINGILKIGKQKYQTVILPVMKVISKEVLELLLDFVKEGGLIVATEELRQQKILIEGIENDKIGSLLKNIKYYKNEKILVKELMKITDFLPVYSTATAQKEGHLFKHQINEILYTKREYSSDTTPFSKAFFLINKDKTNSFNTTIEITGENACLYDPLTGEYKSLKYKANENTLYITMNFPPMGQQIILVDHNLHSEIQDSIDRPLSFEKRISLDGRSRIITHDLNSLTMDRCNFSFDGKLEKEMGYVNEILDKILNKKTRTDLKMEFFVESQLDFKVNRELYLILETPEIFKIQINGISVSSQDCGYHRDISFRKIDIRGLIKKGQNSIKLETVVEPSEKLLEQIKKSEVFESEKNKLTMETEIESIYLLGDFSVGTSGTFTRLPREAIRYKGDFTLIEKVKEADNRLFVKEGYPFFNGTIEIYKTVNLKDTDLNNWFLIFKILYGQVAEIKVNGIITREIFWKPYSVPLDGLLNKGENLIQISITNSLRNLLGPHHLEEGESYFVGPHCFYKEDGIFSKDWSGKLTDWTDDFIFVELGIEGLELVK